MNMKHSHVFEWTNKPLAPICLREALDVPIPRDGAIGNIFSDQVHKNYQMFSDLNESVWENLTADTADSASDQESLFYLRTPSNCVGSTYSITPRRYHP